MSDDNEAAAKQLGELVSRIVEASGTRAQDFLILTNAGGVVACLGLITSSSPHANDFAVRMFLVMYLAGLALVGWTSIRGFIRMQRLAFSFTSALAQYRAGEAEWTSVTSLFSPSAMKHFSDRSMALGAASLSLLLVATLSSCIWLLWPRDNDLPDVLTSPSAAAQSRAQSPAIAGPTPPAARERDDAAVPPVP